jgi:hypothetical protein
MRQVKAGVADLLAERQAALLARRRTEKPPMSFAARRPTSPR